MFSYSGMEREGQWGRRREMRDRDERGEREDERGMETGRKGKEERNTARSGKEDWVLREGKWREKGEE